ncbi:MAG: hypothetical protein SV062_12035, partial [Thermodesulfobacteriota bacterium]|nr:hypothetical protein [Thermodesulfobacteriota bacterium]
KDKIDIIKTNRDIYVKLCQPANALRTSKKILSNDTISISKILDSSILDIEVEQVNENLANARVKVYDKKSKMPLKGLRVSLFNKEKEIASNQIGIESISFLDLKYGYYRFTLNKRGIYIGEISIFIK